MHFKPDLEEDGEVFLYVNPFPQEAERLRFNLIGVSALKGDGREFPLSIFLLEFKSVEMKRQRLMASGRLPPGRYIGLSFMVKEAHLRGEEGEAALLVPVEPFMVDFPFSISRKEALLLSLEFKYKESIKRGFSFRPIFSIFKPDRPVSDLVGYVANYGSSNITVFDKKAMQVVGVIATGRGPRGMALDQISRKAYVALSGHDAVEVIDVAAGRVTNRVRLNTGDNPRELALTPDGSLLLTVNTGSDTVSVIDTVPFIEVDRIRVGDGPVSILMGRNGRRAYAFNTFSNSISVIDLATRSIAGIVSTEREPVRGQFNRSGDRLYVIHEGSSYMTVIDPFTLSALRRIFVGRGTGSIKIDTDTDLVYTGKRQDPTVEIFDPFSDIPVDSIRADGGITYMTIDGEENNLYLVIPGSRTIKVISLISKKTVYEIDVGEGPYWVTLMGER